MGGAIVAWKYTVALTKCTHGNNLITHILLILIAEHSIWLIVSKLLVTILQMDYLKEKMKKTQRCDKSHICPDHPRCSTPTKVVVWGGVSDVVNHAKFHQNRFRSFGSLRGRSLPFTYAWRYGLYNRLGLPPNLWFWVTFMQPPLKYPMDWQYFIGYASERHWTTHITVHGK